ncbi:MAG: flagellar motor switch protein FliG [Spirochaetia bacterium]|nr:flagellar motor switch protein FliG [Spirochaetia bacterium]
MNMKDRLAKAYGQSAPKNPGKAQAAPPSEKARAPSAAAKGKAGAASGRAGLIKAAERSENLIKSGLPGMEKAAKFLLLLGQEEAASVIRHLKPAEIEAISREIARIDRIDTKEANDILTEFGWLAKTQGASLSGGPETAERMLSAAFGADKAKEVLRKAVPESQKPFSFLNEFEARQLVVLLKDESPQVMAMILPYLNPKLASSVISELPDGLRTEVVKRIATLDRMTPEVMEKVEEVLRDRIVRLGRPDSAERIDGTAVLAGILKHVGGGLESRILDGIERDNPDLSQSIRERLFTVDDILRVPDRSVQKALRDLSERELAMMLKGKSQAFRDKILANVSQSKRLIVMEEYDILGTVRREDVDKLTRALVDWFKRRWEDGDLVLEGEEDLVD